MATYKIAVASKLLPVHETNYTKLINFGSFQNKWSVATLESHCEYLISFQTNFIIDQYFMERFEKIDIYNNNVVEA